MLGPTSISCMVRIYQWRIGNSLVYPIVINDPMVKSLVYPCLTIDINDKWDNGVENGSELQPLKRPTLEDPGRSRAMWCWGWVHQSRWQALVDADGCFVEWISPKAWLWRPTLEGDSSWETNNSHKGAQWTRDQGTSAQPNVKCARKTVSVQESERLQTKFGRGPHCSCKPIGQKPTTQIKHTPCVFLTPLISKNNVPLFLMLHPSLLKTFSWYQRQMRPPSKKLMVLRGRVDQARTLWKPSPERLSRAGSVFLAKLERDGWVFDSIHVMV